MAFHVKACSFFWSWPHSLCTATHSKDFADLALSKGSISSKDSRETHRRRAALNTILHDCSPSTPQPCSFDLWVKHILNTNVPLTLALHSWLSLIPISPRPHCCYWNQLWLSSKPLERGQTCCWHCGASTPLCPCHDKLRVTQPAQDSARMRIQSSCLILLHLNDFLLVMGLQFIRSPLGKQLLVYLPSFS